MPANAMHALPDRVSRRGEYGGKNQTVGTNISNGQPCLPPLAQEITTCPFGYICSPLSRRCESPPCSSGSGENDARRLIGQNHPLGRIVKSAICFNISAGPSMKLNDMPRISNFTSPNITIPTSGIDLNSTYDYNAWYMISEISRTALVISAILFLAAILIYLARRGWQSYNSKKVKKHDILQVSKCDVPPPEYSRVYDVSPVSPYPDNPGSLSRTAPTWHIARFPSGTVGEWRILPVLMRDI